MTSLIAAARQSVRRPITRRLPGLVALAMLSLLLAPACSSDSSDDTTSIERRTVSCDTVTDIAVDLCEPLRASADAAEDEDVRDAFSVAHTACVWAFEISADSCPSDPNAPEEGEPDQGDDGNDDGNDDEYDDEYDDDDCIFVIADRVECLALLEDAEAATDPDAQLEYLQAFASCFEALAYELSECLDDDYDEALRCSRFDDVSDEACDELLDVARRANDDDERSLLIDQYHACTDMVESAIETCESESDCAVLLDYDGVCDLLSNTASEVDGDLAERLLDRVDDCHKRVIDSYEHCEDHAN